MAAVAWHAMPLSLMIPIMMLMLTTILLMKMLVKKTKHMMMMMMHIMIMHVSRFPSTSPWKGAQGVLLPPRG